MNFLKKSRCILTNIQILSAIIWAIVIIGCGQLTNNPTLSTLLLTAAGCHFLLLNHFILKTAKKEKA